MFFKHLFGPVSSRRLGTSLGVDLLLPKTCTLDCIYCECGVTSNLTLERKIYVPTKEIISELDKYLKKKPKLDYITFAGSGEPTLAANLEEIVEFIKNKYPAYKIALLTNGTLLFEPYVVDQIKKFDLVKISLDAVTKEIFDKVNKPHAQLEINKILKGIQDFSHNYKGKLWLEIFIVPGFNDQQEELLKIKNIIKEMDYEKVQINSLDRPSAQPGIIQANEKQLLAIADFLKPLRVEIVNLRPAPKDFFRKIKDE